MSGLHWALKKATDFEGTRDFIAAPERAKTQNNNGASAPRHRKYSMKTNTAHQTQSTAIRAGLATLLGLAMLTATASASDNRAPEVPNDIAVPAGHKVHFHGFAVGAQIYTWNGRDWGAAVPEAVLFNGENGVAALHFAGPTWQSHSGSQVVGALPPKSVTVDTNAIPWLRLESVAARTHGPGIFANTKYIHRINTVGGKAPSVNGDFVGQEVHVPYTADYFFYRKSND